MSLVLYFKKNDTYESVNMCERGVSNGWVHDGLGCLYGLVDKTHSILVVMILVLGCRLVPIFWDYSCTQKHSNQKQKQFCTNFPFL